MNVMCSCKNIKEQRAPLCLLHLCNGLSRRTAKHMSYVCYVIPANLFLAVSLLSTVSGAQCVTKVVWCSESALKSS